MDSSEFTEVFEVRLAYLKRCWDEFLHTLIRENFFDIAFLFAKQEETELGKCHSVVECFSLEEIVFPFTFLLSNSVHPERFKPLNFDGGILKGSGSIHGFSETCFAFGNFSGKEGACVENSK